VIAVIARQVQSNIRELEGAFNRVVANAQLTGVPLTVEMATAALADLLAARHRYRWTKSSVWWPNITA